MRLLLTGATGFLGRHVAHAAAGWPVWRATRASLATAPDEIALGAAAWTQASFAHALEIARPDVVLHCAGALPGATPAECFAGNAVLAAELLAAVSDVRERPRVMLVGSAAEYGFVREESQPVAETHPCAPRHVYAVSKHAQTLLGLAAEGPVLVVRLFNAVGVGMPPRLALPSFARRIVAAGQGGVVRVGDLSARRDFIDVAEAARLLLGVAGLPEWPFRVVNLCSGQAYAIGDLLAMLIAASGAAVTVQTDPLLARAGDMACLVGSTQRLERAGLPPRAPDFAAILPRMLAEARAGQAA